MIRAVSGRKSGKTRKRGSVSVRILRRMILCLFSSVLVIVVSASCGTARRGVGGKDVVASRNPVIVRGEQVFARNCSRCHPGGEAGLGPAINNKPLPEALIKFQVRNGLGAMPAFSEEELPDTDLEAVSAYLEYLRDGKE